MVKQIARGELRPGEAKRLIEQARREQQALEGPTEAEAQAAQPAPPAAE